MAKLFGRKRRVKERNNQMKNSTVCLGKYIKLSEIFDISQVTPNFFSRKSHFYVILFPDGQKIRLSGRTNEISLQRRNLLAKLEEYRT